MKKRYFMLLVGILCLLPVPAANAWGAGGWGPATRLAAAQGIQKESLLRAETGNLELLKQFSDYGEIMTRYPHEQETLAVLVEKGILQGFEDNTLRLNAPLTRAEYAVMLYRAQPYFDELPKLVDYSAAYMDVADWNAEAVRFCMERGLMIGEGDRFDVEGTLLQRQETVVRRRMRYGLYCAEKYALLSLCGTSPIDMDKINQSAYDAALGPVPVTNEYIVATMEEKQNELQLLQDYVELDYNFDDRILDTQEKRRDLANRLNRLTEFNREFPEDRTETLLEGLNANAQGGYHAECFFVSAPERVFRTPGNGGVSIYEAKGYLYFKIDGGMERAAENNLPAYGKISAQKPELDKRPAYQVEPGKWYRQIVTVSRYQSLRTGYYNVLGTNTIEPVPADFLN